MHVVLSYLPYLLDLGEHIGLWGREGGGGVCGYFEVIIWVPNHKEMGPFLWGKLTPEDIM